MNLKANFLNLIPSSFIGLTITNQPNCKKSLSIFLYFLVNLIFVIFTIPMAVKIFEQQVSTTDMIILIGASILILLLYMFMIIFFVLLAMLILKTTEFRILYKVCLYSFISFIYSLQLVFIVLLVNFTPFLISNDDLKDKIAEYMSGNSALIIFSMIMLFVIHCYDIWVFIRNCKNLYFDDEKKIDEK